MMVKPVTDIEITQSETGAVYINVIRCDGTKGTPVLIPCNCTASDVDLGELPDLQWCALANSIANVLKRTLGRLEEMVSEQALTNFAAAGLFIAEFHFPVSYWGPVQAYLDANETVLISIDWGLDNSLGTDLEQALVCAAYNAIAANNGVIDSGWITQMQYYLSSSAPQTRCDAAGWNAIAAYVSLIGLDYWQLWAVGDYGNTESGELTAGFAVGCGNCDPPVSGGDCAASYTEYLYDWESAELIGTRGCYGNGQFTPCAPYNSVQVIDAIEVDLGVERCIKSFRFAEAGNSQVDWIDVEYRIDGVLVGVQTNIVGVTRCATSLLGYSGAFTPAAPVVGQVITITPTRRTGAAPTSSAIDVHCVRVEWGEVI